jgi:peptide chain release factor 1
MTVYNDYLQQELSRIDDEIEANKKLINDPEMAELAREEIAELERQKHELQNGVDNKPGDRADNQMNKETSGNKKNNIAILELRAATGGDEAKIWADDLKRMYIRYAGNQGWKFEETEGGIVKIWGVGVYSALQNEAGVHRVQRVPVTESQGRIHTSTATVAVLPEIKPSEVALEDKDVEFESFRRSSGAGGQNVNKVATAVRLIHKPTGIKVESSSERTQIGNREAAMKLLASKIWALQEEERLAKLEDARTVIGRGMRSEKIRTYNYPQNRVTDHRLRKSWHDLDMIMEGKLGKIVKNLMEEL